MSFTERLHPRDDDGKFKGGSSGRPRVGDLQVTTRRRNGPAMDATPGRSTRQQTMGAAAMGDARAAMARDSGARQREAAYNAGPKDAPFYEVMAADKVQMHRWDDEKGTWGTEGDPVDPNTAVELARNAVVNHGQQVRLTVAKAPAGRGPAAADAARRDMARQAGPRGSGGRPPGSRAVKDADGTELGFMRSAISETDIRADYGNISLGVNRRKTWRAYTPDGRDVGLTFLNTDDVRRTLREERRRAR